MTVTHEPGHLPDLLAALRHELLTPVNHIIGYGEMLQEQAEDQNEESYVLDLQRIQAAGRHLATLISDNLSPEGVESGKSGVDCLSCELRALLDIILFHSEALRNQARGREDFAPDLEKISQAANHLRASINSRLPVSNLASGARPERASVSTISDLVRGAGAAAPPVERAGSLSRHSSPGSLLVVDDNPTSREMLSSRLKRQGHSVAVAESGRAALAMIKEENFDLVLLDMMMPDIDGYQVLERLNADGMLRQLPVIVLSALDEVASIVKCIEIGADDYLPKPPNSVLLQARIAACLEKKRLRDQEEFYRERLESANAGLERRVEERVAQLRNANRKLKLEVSERKLLDKRLQTSMAEMRAEKERATTTLAHLRALLDGVQAGVLLLDEANETVLWANHLFAEFFGIDDLEEIVGRTGLWPRVRELVQRSSADPEGYAANTDQVLEDRYFSGTEELATVYPWERTLQCFTTPIYGGETEYIGRLWVYNDVTEQRRLEQQVIQSQKMESVGQLAGGIAHDFNNLLTPIIGYTELGAVALSPDHPTRASLEEIKKAALRAANLTRQLLAFSRRQILEPKVFNLNDLVLDIGKMLRRLIGENIELVTNMGPELGLVKVDYGQFEQVLVNLAVNGRDAMPDGGTLTITTENFTLEPDSAVQYPESTPGEYVLLTISDTGSGMTEGVKAHLFEPFFTTKEQGKGTGLGLATCYGIVNQNGGYISVESEPGLGATFRVYLPIIEESASALLVDHEGEGMAPGLETVLLVEDEVSVRRLAKRVLRGLGYTVLEASDGVDALAKVEKYAGREIHLLLTDVIMPQMGGAELARRLRAIHPETRVLYTSGYTNDDTFLQEVVGAEVEFMGKPFSPPALARKVRELLDKGPLTGSLPSSVPSRSRRAMPKQPGFGE